jgi:hypothetical protein
MENPLVVVYHLHPQFILPSPNKPNSNYATLLINNNKYYVTLEFHFSNNANLKLHCASLVIQTKN